MNKVITKKCQDSVAFVREYLKVNVNASCSDFILFVSDALTQTIVPVTIALELLVAYSNIYEIFNHFFERDDDYTVTTGSSSTVLETHCTKCTVPNDNDEILFFCSLTVLLNCMFALQVADYCRDK